MDEFWYDYVNPMYAEKIKFCYMNKNSFIVYIKTEGIYVDIAKYVEVRFHAANNELEIIGLMKDELCSNIMTEFAALRPKTYSYLTDDIIESKKRKKHKKVCNKTKLKTEDCKTSLEITQIENEIIFLEKNKGDADSLRENILK